jgi:hypothetical protein
MILASDPAAGLANDAVTGGADGAVADWNAEALSGEISPCDLDAFAAALRERAEATGAHAVIVDNTSSEARIYSSRRSPYDRVRVVNFIP